MLKEGFIKDAQTYNIIARIIYFDDGQIFVRWYNDKFPQVYDNLIKFQSECLSDGKYYLV